MTNRLTIMTEVLPEPLEVPKSPTNVRARVLSRLKALSAQAAGLSAVSACIGYGCVDPLPDPVVCSDSNASNWLTNAEARPIPSGVRAEFTLADAEFISGLSFRSAVVRVGGSANSLVDGSVMKVDVVPDTSPVMVLLDVTMGCSGASDQVASFIIETEEDGFPFMRQVHLGSTGANPGDFTFPDGGLGDGGNADGGSTDAGNRNDGGTGDAGM